MINYKINDNNKYLPVEGGTLSGDLNMGGRLIKNVADPINDSDAITKKYVKNNFASQEDFSAIGILLSLNNIVLLKVVNCNGVPAEGITVSGMKGADGKDVVTDDKGLANGVCSGSTVTFKTYGMTDYNHNISSIKGSSRRTIVTLPSLEGKILTYESSTTIKFTTNIIKNIDVCCVGGGGGGGGSIADSGLHSSEGSHAVSIDYYGGGGAGGNIVNKYNVTFNKNQSYSITIGSGGSGGNGAYNSYVYVSTVNTTAGGTGGTTSAFGVSASGGTGGIAISNTSYVSNNGGTSTNGGNGGHGANGNGNASTGTRFDDGITKYSGGGAGVGGTGGAPYGGGTGAYSVATSGTGTGGGGQCGSFNYSNHGGSGYKGLVAIRLHDATL